MTKEEILKLEGRELDAAVAERVMGWRWLNLPGLRRPCFKSPSELAQFLPKFVERNTVICDDSPPVRLPHYSTDLNAAWQVVEEVTAIAHSGDGWGLRFREWWREEDLCFASAQEAAKEICLNALLVASEASQ